MEVDLLLSRPCLAFGALDFDACFLHAFANGADERLVIAGREHVVVEDVRDRWREVRVVHGVRLRERFFHEVELELGAEHGLEAHRLRTFDLCPEHLAR